MTTPRKSRGQIINRTDIVQLHALFKDSNGDVADLDALPTITLEEPSGNVALGPTSAGVYHLSTGLYGFDWQTGYNSSIGVWSDIWDGLLNGFRVSGAFNFVIHNTQMPFVNTDGYEALGDDPGFNYSQISIHNINLLIKTLKARLDSSGKVQSTDEYGNIVYVDCDIYSTEQLAAFLANSLTAFNQIPHFTFYTFEDTDMIQQFHDVIVQGATLMALAGKALLEKGKEFQITDNSLSLPLPGVSDMMQTEWAAELANHWEKVKMIKANLKPSPMGLGTMTISTTRHPAIARLRHLKARQIF